MKKVFKYIFVTMLSVATFAMVGCGGEEEPGNGGGNGGNGGGNGGGTTSIVGKSFKGSNDNVGTFAYQGYDLPVEMTLTTQFTSETQVSITFDFVINGQPQNPSVQTFSYTLDGQNGKILNGSNAMEFFWDQNAKTINLPSVYVTLGDGSGNNSTVGGEFTLREI